MTIRIFVDRDKCQTYAQCCYESPEIFQILEDGSMEYLAEVDDAHAADVERAADVCPMQAITFEFS